MNLLDADVWLVETLRGDSQLQAIHGQRVYIDHAEPGTAYPLVTVRMPAPGAPLTNASADLILQRGLRQVRFVTDQPSYADLSSAATRALQLLHKASSPAHGVLECVFEDIHRYEEIVSQTVYKTIVLQFRIASQ